MDLFCAAALILQCHGDDGHDGHDGDGSRSPPGPHSNEHRAHRAVLRMGFFADLESTT